MGLLERGGVDVTACALALDLVLSAGEDGLSLSSPLVSFLVGVAALVMDLVLGESNRVGVAPLVRDLVDADGELELDANTEGRVGVDGLTFVGGGAGTLRPRLLVTTGVDETTSETGIAPR